MCAVLVYIDILHLFGIDIASNVVALVDNKALLASLVCFVCKDRTKQSRTDNKIIVM